MAVIRVIMTGQARAAFSRRKMDLHFRKKLQKFYIRGVAVDGSEIWTLRKIDQKYLEGFKIYCWRRMEQIIWVDRVRNEEVLHSQGRQECSAYDRKKEG
jgi:hypothetical protein